MKAFVNQHIFTQTSLDSGALTQLAVIVRNFPEPGAYLGSIFHREQSIGQFYLAIDPNSPEAQLNIDLATVGRGRHAEERSDNTSSEHFVVSPKAYVIFHVSYGAGGFAVTVAKLGDTRETVEPFDSRELTRGDLFAVTLIRPGKYTATNLNGTARAEIRVAYPQLGREPFSPGEPVRVECTNGGFEPSSIRIDAAQGQVYRVQTERPARIKIELLEPDDGPRYEAKRI